MKENALLGPGLRLGAAVAPRHGVVEPVVGSVAVDMNGVGFAVPLEAIAKPPHIVDWLRMPVTAEPCRSACARKLVSMKASIGGATLSSPIATKASRLALMPSANRAASGAMTCSRT